MNKCLTCIHTPPCQLCTNYDSYTQAHEVDPDDYTRAPGCTSTRSAFISAKKVVSNIKSKAHWEL
jgi:hypothetical protein